MDFGFSPQEEAFRNEVRDFIKAEFPSDLRWHYRSTLAPAIFSFEGENLEFIKKMSKKLGDRGWLSLNWPEEYGGRNSWLLQNILYEEMLYNNFPGINPQGVTFLAPTLLRFGSEDQKKLFLPGIASGEVWWCELLSEPDSGSDLASVKTKATEEGDSWIIDGQKTWSSGAQLSDWGFILVRTDLNLARHRGLSYFLVDMKTPGITVNPITNLLGEQEFNEVFLDNVRVPKENMVGDINKGWYITMATLDFERASHIFFPTIRGYLDFLLEFVKQTDRPLGPEMRNRAAELLAECEMARMIHYRAVWMMERGIIPTYEVAIDKMFNSELAHKAADFGMQVLGHYGALLEGSKYACLNGWPGFYYQDTVSYPIMGGTSEIDRNVIAMRGLGLPAE